MKTQQLIISTHFTQLKSYVSLLIHSHVNRPPLNVTQQIFKVLASRLFSFRRRLLTHKPCKRTRSGSSTSKTVPRDLEPPSKLSEHVFHGGLHRPRPGSDAAASRQRLSLAAPLPAARRRRLDSSFHSSLSYSREGDISPASARL